MFNEKRRSLLLGLGAASLMAAGSANKVFAATTASAAPVAPPDFTHKEVSDVRGWALNKSGASPVNKVARDAFVKRKVQTAYTHPAQSKEMRDAKVDQIVQRVGAQAMDAMSTPIPGGAGYGVFYTDSFKNAWESGTAISHDLICPNRPGGNVDYFLYLTSCNRSAYGVEAFVSYYAQEQPSFKIYDWALASSNPWQLEIPFEYLGAYLFPASSLDKSPQRLSIWNATFSLGGQFYRNEVFLYNYKRHGWDLVYQYDYASDDYLQRNSWIGSWGPIVESFQSFYRGTNPMGVRRTMLASADSFGRWSKWELLQAAQSVVRNDNVGFEVRNIAPNFAFIALS